jgi:hypothetical protein
VPFFTEQMEMLANELITSKQERAAFVSDVRQESHKIIADAQTFMRAVGTEHKAMASRLHKEMTTYEQQRVRTAKARQQRNREQIKNARKELLDMLAQNCRQRHQHIAQFRKDLSSDLRQAAKIWQRVAQVSATPNAGSKGKGKATSSATATNPSAKGVETAKSPDLGRNPPESKPAAGAAAQGGHQKPAEAGHSQDHGRNQTTESKKTQDASHGNQGKSK